MAEGIGDISAESLGELERTAVELAQLAGAEIAAAMSRPFAVHYKGEQPEAELYRDPVSEVDRNTELLVRARLAQRYPEHDIIGEEMDERPGRGHDFIWAIDPVDGTANFVNGFPLFAASIGLVWRGLPLVGAVWCASTHALRTGIYHARRGGPLCFDGQPLEPRRNLAVRRHLAAEPVARESAHLPWDVRQTGSSAIECAFVAAGILRVARFEGPNLWDVAGGIPLVIASGATVRTWSDGGWKSFERFEPRAVAGEGPAPAPDLRHWRGRLVLGEPRAVQLYCES